MPSRKVSVLLDLLQENDSCSWSTPLNNTALLLLLKPTHSSLISSSATGQSCGGLDNYVEYTRGWDASQSQDTLHTLIHTLGQFTIDSQPTCMFREVGGNQRTCRKNSRQPVTLVQDQTRDVYGNNAILWASCYNLVAVKTRHTTIFCKHTLPSSDVLPICLIIPRSCLELGDLGRHKVSKTSKSTYN